MPTRPATPSLFQTMGWWTRPISFLERNRARYGKRFTIRLLVERLFVMLSDPADVKEVYTPPPMCSTQVKVRGSSPPSSARTP